MEPTLDPQPGVRAGLLALEGSFGSWRELKLQFIALAKSLKAPHGSTPEVQREIACSVCSQLVKALWDTCTESNRRWWVSPKTSMPASLPIRRLAQEAADALRHLSLVESSYLISNLYASLLPHEVRSSGGIYYTPPILAERLLDLVAVEGVDWAQVRALDPACGGGAFLVPLAHRILGDHRICCLKPTDQLAHLESSLAGIEIDSFAAWMSRVFLQLLVFQLSVAAGRALKLPLQVADTLDVVLTEEKQFDLVIGNPPYGRLTLDAEQRRFFGRSLYGHANLYGVFLDAALRFRKRSGLVAFVTPTSFLGGQYFSKLRSLLLDEAPPLVIDIVEARTGVFDEVLQETCLAVFGDNPSRSATVHLLDVSDRSLTITRAGVFSIDGTAGEPWFLPRSPQQARLADGARALQTRLHHLGYKASTGPLVWNRHKDQLLSSYCKGAFPLIWAEAVRAASFNFNYRTRSSAPFVFLRENQEFLLSSGPCVLVQRTTAKEQERRLIACTLPDDFIHRWDKFVVENHVNVLHITEPDHVSPRALSAILNTRIVDQVFRCLSGSVAVSAAELHALPLPAKEVFEEVDVLLADTPTRSSHRVQKEVEMAVARSYGVHEE